MFSEGHRGESILCLSSWLLVLPASLARLGWWIQLSCLCFHHHVAIVFPLCERGCLLIRTPVVWDLAPILLQDDLVSTLHVSNNPISK